MKPRLIFKATCLFLLVICGGSPLLAQSDAELSRTLRRGFYLPSNGNVEIINKYGQIIVNSWDEDSVYLEITVIAYGRSDEVVEKMINRVDFDFDQTGDYLTLKTILDRQSSSFKEFVNSVGDASKALLSKNRLVIDYDIYVPISANLDLENKFGNIYLDEIHGALKLNLSQGDLRAREINGSARIDLSFGKANIKSIENGSLTLKATEIDIEKAGKLSITSSSSEMHLNYVDMIQLESRNDQIEILEAKAIEGSGRFTNIDNGFLIDNLDLDMDYGELNLYRIEDTYDAIQISGKSTDILLKFEPEAFLEVDITARNENLVYPDVPMHLESNYLDDRNKLVKITGTVGNNRVHKSTLKLNSEGDIRIGFLQIRTQTKREP